METNTSNLSENLGTMGRNISGNIGNATGVAHQTIGAFA